jgi:hypothetical protein
MDHTELLERSAQVRSASELEQTLDDARDAHAIDQLEYRLLTMISQVNFGQARGLLMYLISLSFENEHERTNDDQLIKPHVYRDCVSILETILDSRAARNKDRNT